MAKVYLGSMTDTRLVFLEELLKELGFSIVRVPTTAITYPKVVGLLVDDDLIVEVAPAGRDSFSGTLYSKWCPYRLHSSDYSPSQLIGALSLVVAAHSLSISILSPEVSKRRSEIEQKLLSTFAQLPM